MDGIEIDAASRTARVGAGVTWARAGRGDPGARAGRHGRAAVRPRASRASRSATGSGWLERALGPTGGEPDRRRGGAAGRRVVEARRGRRPRRRHAARPAAAPRRPELLCGFLTFPRERAAEVARAYRDYMRTAPGEVGGGLLLGAGLGGVCTIVVLPPRQRVEAARRPSRRCASCGRRWTPSRPTSTSRSSASGTRATRPGRARHVRGGVLRELPDDCLDAVGRAGEPAGREPLLRLPPAARRRAPGRRVGLPVRRPVAAGPRSRPRAGRLGGRLRAGRRARGQAPRCHALNADSSSSGAVASTSSLRSAWVAAIVCRIWVT